MVKYKFTNAAFQENKIVLFSVAETYKIKHGVMRQVSNREICLCFAENVNYCIKLYDFSFNYKAI